MDGKCIGSCVLFNVNTTAQTCELGLGIGDKDLWGKGLGQECVRLLLQYALKFLNYRNPLLSALKQRPVRRFLHGFHHRPATEQIRTADGRTTISKFMVSLIRIVDTFIRNCCLHFLINEMALYAERAGWIEKS